MDLQSLTLFNMANKKMDWLAQRQSVLAENIANNDTPNYISKDVAPVDFSKELARTNSIHLATTNDKHISTSGSNNVGLTVTNNKHLTGTARNNKFAVKENRETFETTLDENGVTLEEEMAKIGEVQHDYDVSTTIYNKYMGMIRASLGKGR